MGLFGVLISLFILLFKIAIILLILELVIKSAIAISNTIFSSQTDTRRTTSTFTGGKRVIIKEACNNCGRELDNGWIVCPHCGRPR